MTELKVEKFTKPGRLSGDMQLSINTMEAQRLFSGSHGLFPFATQMLQLVRASLADDPYADYYLLSAYDELMRLNKELNETIKAYQEKLNCFFNRQNIKIDPLVSEKPVIKLLNFKTQYGYIGANLIADVDRLFCIALTSYRVGIILEKSFDSLKDEWHKKIRNVFKKVFKWQNLGIARRNYSPLQ